MPDRTFPCLGFCDSVCAIDVEKNFVYRAKTYPPALDFWPPCHTDREGFIPLPRSYE